MAANRTSNRAMALVNYVINCAPAAHWMSRATLKLAKNGWQSALLSHHMRRPCLARRFIITGGFHITYYLHIFGCLVADASLSAAAKVMNSASHHSHHPSVDDDKSMCNNGADSIAHNLENPQNVEITMWRCNKTVAPRALQSHCTPT